MVILTAPARRQYAKYKVPNRTRISTHIPIIFTGYLKAGFHGENAHPRLRDRANTIIDLLSVVVSRVGIASLQAATASYRTWSVSI